MKKSTLSLVFTLFISFFAFGQVTNLPIAFDDISALTELNGGFQGNGYPWISDDGLRIYFIRQDQPPLTSTIYHAERTSLEDAFTNIQVLSVSNPDFYNYSPWLTNDELTIYFSTSELSGISFSSLYRATRNSVDEDFGDPIFIQLEGPTLGFEASASLTEDASQLYMYGSDGTDKTIFAYEPSGPDSYVVTETLELPMGFDPSPCKLSPDGLHLYLGVSSANQPIQLYVFQRDSLEEQFSDLFFLENNQLNPSSFYNRQPAIGCGGNCLAFTRGNTNTFSANDLWLASREPTASQNIFRPAVEATVFPNPAVDFIKFEFEAPEKYTGLRLLVFNANGQIVTESTLPNTSDVLHLDVTEFRSGSYFYQLRSHELLLVAGKFLVE